MKSTFGTHRRSRNRLWRAGVPHAATFRCASGVVVGTRLPRVPPPAHSYKLVALIGEASGVSCVCLSFSFSVNSGRGLNELSFRVVYVVRALVRVPLGDA